MKLINGWWVPSSDLYFDEKTLRPEGFDIDHLAVALQYVKHWRTAVDAGSHIGTWAKAMAVKFEKVYAIEPDGANYSCLLRNTDHLPNVTPYKFALSNVDGGEVAMRDSAVRVGNSGARHCIAGRGIPTRTLDSLHVETLDFLKLDVESYEYYALLGSQRTLARCKPVVFIEQKKFKDTEGRPPVDYKAAATYLESMGMKCVDRVKNDHIFTWQ